MYLNLAKSSPVIALLTAAAFEKAWPLSPFAATPAALTSYERMVNGADSGSMTISQTVKAAYVVHGPQSRSQSYVAMELVSLTSLTDKGNSKEHDGQDLQNQLVLVFWLDLFADFLMLSIHRGNSRLQHEDGHANNINLSFIVKLKFHQGSKAPLPGTQRREEAF